MDKPFIDELWRRLEPLLPQAKARREKYPGRKPVPDRHDVTQLLPFIDAIPAIRGIRVRPCKSLK
ncbi:hypothetical protein WM40_24670 [Robbsia andropogonis]|uniref:Uncharacterized protein n=1 Tax=Robbsia andropogonis TaxID=28092 RepID=A0A0F5JU78_9BURK|nr:hypothetical protein WM40_24670 [Robbsia andropogonis]